MDYYSHLQKKARGNLNGYWLRAIVAVCVYLAAEAAVNLIFQVGAVLTNAEEKAFEAYIWILVMAVASAIISAPLGLGFRLFLWRRSRGEHPSVSSVIELFCDVGRLFGSVLLETVKYIIIGLPALVLAIPLVLYSGNQRFAQLMHNSGIIMIIFVFTALIGVAYAVYMYLRLFAVDYIFVGEGLSAFKSVARAFRLTSGKVRYIIPLYLKFIPWLLLNATGFAQLFVTPYFEMAKCCIIADLIEYTPNAAAKSEVSPLGGTA